MQIKIENHYHDRFHNKIYQGSLVDVKWAILQDFPRLDYIDGMPLPLNERLKLMLREINRGQMYSTQILSGSLDSVNIDNAILGKNIDDTLVNDMFGFQPQSSPEFEAARQLAGKAMVAKEIARQSLHEFSGDYAKAALKAYGLDVTAENLEALEAVLALQSLKLEKKINPKDFEGVTQHYPTVDISHPTKGDMTVHQHPDSLKTALVDHSLETTPHMQLAAEYHAHVNGPNKVQPEKPKVNTKSRKLIYGGVSTHLNENSRFMLKPYVNTLGSVDRQYHAGWNEMTSQALYHAGGIGNYHQKVHVTEHETPLLVHDPNSGHKAIRAKVPYTATYMDSDYSHEKPSPKMAAKHRDVAAKMVLMDFVTNQWDKFDANIMHHRTTGAPLAIDNEAAFAYPELGDSMLPDMGSHVLADVGNPLQHYIGSFSHPDVHQNFGKAFAWWKTAAPAIKKTFTERLNLIKDPKLKARLTKGFSQRANHLDRIAKEGPNAQNLMEPIA